MKPAIEVKHVTKYYGKFLALKGINFEVREGEVFGFLGPNGAGKTTTQKILTGILKPSTGHVSILGYDMEKDPFNAKRFTGIVPDETNAYVDLNAWDNLKLIGELYGMPKKAIEKKAGELLEIFQLYERRRDKVKGFSKGMKRRLILSMGLIHSPRILFLDEPTSGLDVRSTRLIRKMIEDMNKEGVTVFLTTHDIEEANQMCDRVAIIYQGEIAAIDRPENLKKAVKAAQSIEVSFTKKIENPEELAYLPEVDEVKKQGDKLRLLTREPGKVIKPLVDYAHRKNLEFLTLNTLGPSLEEVFVKLTEDKESEAGVGS